MKHLRLWGGTFPEEYQYKRPTPEEEEKVQAELRQMRQALKGPIARLLFRGLDATDEQKTENRKRSKRAAEIVGGFVAVAAVAGGLHVTFDGSPVLAMPQVATSAPGPEMSTIPACVQHGSHLVSIALEVEPVPIQSLAIQVEPQVPGTDSCNELSYINLFERDNPEIKTNDGIIETQTLTTLGPSEVVLNLPVSVAPAIPQS